jgi:hypothetical protein
MFLYTLCSAFKHAKIPYAVVGGYAVALHGAARGTMDVDIVIRWTLKNLQQVENVLKGLGLVSLHPIDADSVYHFRDEYINKRNLIGWHFYDPINPSNQVDIIITYDLKKGHTKNVKTAKGEVNILSLKDLIKMKKASGRPQDLEDIEALENL